MRGSEKSQILELIAEMLGCDSFPGLYHAVSDGKVLSEKNRTG